MKHKTDKLILRKVNARIVRLDDTSYIEERNENNEIVRLYKQNSEIEITAGSVVKYKDVPHKVNLIVPGKSGANTVCYDLMCASLNTSSIFITPLLGFKKEELFWNSQFINAFMSIPHNDVCIALLYRYSGHIEFVKFEAWVKQQPTFLKSYDPDHHHVLYVFSIPKVGSKVYDLVREGRYSEIDDLWKLIILQFHGFDRNGTTGQILYKDLRLKNQIEDKVGMDIGDAELHSIPNMSYERFDSEYYSINGTKKQTSNTQDNEESTMGGDAFSSGLNKYGISDF